MTAPTPRDSAPALTAAAAAQLEARVAAMSALVKSLLTTLMLRGLLTRAEIAPLIADAEALVKTADPISRAAANTELGTIQSDLPGYLRAAMGPEPEEGDHDH